MERATIINKIKQAKSEHELDLIHYDHVRTVHSDPYLKAMMRHRRYELILESLTKKQKYD